MERANQGYETETMKFQSKTTYLPSVKFARVLTGTVAQ